MTDGSGNPVLRRVEPSMTVLVDLRAAPARDPNAMGRTAENAGATRTNAACVLLGGEIEAHARFSPCSIHSCRRSSVAVQRAWSRSSGQPCSETETPGTILRTKHVQPWTDALTQVHPSWLGRTVSTLLLLMSDSHLRRIAHRKIVPISTPAPNDSGASRHARHDAVRGSRTMTIIGVLSVSAACASDYVLRN